MTLEEILSNIRLLSPEEQLVLSGTHKDSDATEAPFSPDDKSQIFEAISKNYTSKPGRDLLERMRSLVEKNVFYSTQKGAYVHSEQCYQINMPSLVQ